MRMLHAAAAAERRYAHAAVDVISSEMLLHLRGLQLADTISFGVSKVNVDADSHSALTRAVAAHVLDRWQGALEVDGGIGDKRRYDLRAWSAPPKRRWPLAFAKRARRLDRRVRSLANVERGDSAAAAGYPARRHDLEPDALGPLQQLAPAMNVMRTRSREWCVLEQQAIGTPRDPPRRSARAR
jgi:hypothetical protein